MLTLTGTVVLLAGCTPKLQPLHAAFQAPRLAEDHVILDDGARLPLRSWLPEGEPRAVVVALHGFTDYSAAFAGLADKLMADGVALYAYDQRGFGGAPYRGIWPGTARLVGDLGEVVALVREAYPAAPIVLVGESMGAAVVLVAMGRELITGVSGVVLVAPAVWGWRVMSPLLSGPLYALAHTMPWLEISAQPQRCRASDNDAMLAALDRDPQVLQRVRVDTVYGLVTLMDEAIEAAPALTVPALVLYGAHEHIIPSHARKAFLQRLNSARRVNLYPKGHHTLLRDLNAEIVIEDISRWILAQCDARNRTCEGMVSRSVVPDGLSSPLMSSQAQ